ncbi:MAG: hypothetical protein K9J50_03605 [Sulfuritalea sp.]|nr:hypothetical protein [Sulfuritalea sp.]
MTPNKSHLLNVVLSFASLVLIAPAFAWNPFAEKKSLKEVELSAAEWQKVDLVAGWAADSDSNLLIEMKNNLPGPLACHAVLVNLQSGGPVQKAFSPYLYIAPAATKQTSVNGVKKGLLKDYALNCSCWKKEGVKTCVDPGKK